MTVRSGKDASRLEEFIAAVHAFNDDPSKRNLARYLKASRELDRRASKTAALRRAQWTARVGTAT